MRDPPVLPIMLTLLATAGCTAPSLGSANPATPPTTPGATEDVETTTEPTPTEPASATLEVDWSVPFTITTPSPFWRRLPEISENIVGIEAGSWWIVFSTDGPDSVDGWVDLLTSAPELEVTEPRPVEVGRASGQVLDARLSSGAAERGCPHLGSARCWPLLRDGWGIVADTPNRIWVVDVDGETVLIATEASENRFDERMETVEDALSTI